MKNLSIITLCLMANSLFCAADTFTLKDGTKLEGRILSEEKDVYLLEVQITKSIRDERKVLKADVAEITRVSPDLIAYEAISKFIPTPDLLTADEYSQRISAIEKFLEAHPTTSKAKDVAVMLEILKSELVQISAGGLKIKGNIVTVEDYKLNAYELDAQVLDVKIRRLLESGQVASALRAFTKFDANYSGTILREPLLPLIKRAIQAQSAEAKQLLATFESRKKERETDLRRMSAENRRMAEASLAEEDAASLALYNSELQAAVGWPTLSPFVQESLDATITFAETEMSRINEPLSYQSDSGKVYRDAWALIHQGGEASAVAAAISATTEALIPEYYKAKLEAAATADAPLVTE